ncbi:MAG: hypothetical protein JNJ40_10130 [Bacteroidia bacterium]|nr:hypothetical protein [Bacteroidia bacterium]
MKKTLVLAAIAGIALASCKKDRTCTCTNSTISQTSTEPGYTYTPQPASTNKTTYKKIKKKNVMAQLCVTSEETHSYSYQNFSPTGTATYVMTVNTKSDCELE